MEYIFKTDSEEEAKDIMNIKKVKYMMNSLEDFANSLEKSSHSTIYSLYKGKLVPVSELHYKMKNNPKVERYINIDDVISYIEDLLSEYSEED